MSARSFGRDLLATIARRPLVELRVTIAKQRATIAKLRAQIDAVYVLHTDSPASVCPSCYRLDDVSDTHDGLVPWPCPTLRALGVEDLFGKPTQDGAR